MGMMEEIIGYIVGVVGAISIFACGYMFGKMAGLHKAEKMFDKAIDEAVKRG